MDAIEDFHAGLQRVAEAAEKLPPLLKALGEIGYNSSRSADMADVACAIEDEIGDALKAINLVIDSLPPEE